MEGKILVVDDDPLIRDSLSEILRMEGHKVHTASSGKEAIEILDNDTFNIVIADIRMPEVTGMDLLRHIKQTHPTTDVIMITGFGSIQNAVEAMKEGATDYITKPVMDEDIKARIKRILEHQKLRHEYDILKEQVKSREQFYELVGHDPKMQEIYTMIETIAGTDCSILITGESGTGKRLIARAIHFHDPSRRDGPFIEVSCGALPENLLESELFGHVKGSFTSAFRDRIGRFELANGGTILLDDIDTLTPALQVKLLRVLQEQEFERVGDTKTIKVDVRVIATTNADLEKLIEEGKFREDLYYRLNVVSIHVPPLRERPGDIPLLAQYFLEKFCKEMGREKVLSDEAIQALVSYKWPGNVRELENAIERAVIISKGRVIRLEDLPEQIWRRTVPQLKVQRIGSLREALKHPERHIILEALRQTGWNKKAAAELLGISRSTLYNKMKECGINPRLMQGNGGRGDYNGRNGHEPLSSS